jgi:hypothetical protein
LRKHSRLHACCHGCNDDRGVELSRTRVAPDKARTRHAAQPSPVSLASASLRRVHWPCWWLASRRTMAKECGTGACRSRRVDWRNRTTPSCGRGEGLTRGTLGLPGLHAASAGLVVKKAPPGFEPGIKVLQTSALPLGYGAAPRRVYPPWSCLLNSRRKGREHRI